MARTTKAQRLESAKRLIQSTLQQMLEVERKIDQTSGAAAMYFPMGSAAYTEEGKAQLEAWHRVREESGEAKLFSARCELETALNLLSQ